MFGLALAALAGCGGGSGGAGTPTPTPALTPTPLPTAVVTPSPVPVASTIVFSPDTIALDNPTSPGSFTQATSFVVDVTAYDEQGQIITPSADDPITVEVYGAPDGVISPRTAQLTSGSALTLHYDGSYFADPIVLVAWIDRPAGAAQRIAAADAGPGQSIGRIQMLPGNQVDCAHGAGSYALPLLCPNGDDPGTCPKDALANPLKVRAAIGHDDPRGNWGEFTIDTGSVGAVVPLDKLGKGAKGRGRAGQVFYDSSGRIFSGHYYLAKVAFEIDGRVVETPPMMVLAISRQTCAPGYPNCRSDDHPQLHYLGVGFGRPQTAGDAFVSPADNAFLQLASGSGFSPGYVLTGNAATVGITSSAGFKLEPLVPSSTEPGDWSPPTGCFSFPDLPEPNRFCGNFLLDVGLASMFIDLPPAERPATSSVEATCPPGSVNTCHVVPEHTVMQVLSGSPDDPAMFYQFTVESNPVGPAPTQVEWLDKTPVFINTGRRPLFAFDYLFDARCGNVGFKPLE